MNYSELAHYYAEQSTCRKRRVGCVVVQDGRVVAYGFNHGYSERCTCVLEGKNPHVLHAEQMALSGEDVEIYEGADLYVTYKPCEKCSIMIEKLKIGRVILV